MTTVVNTKDRYMTYLRFLRTLNAVVLPERRLTDKETNILSFILTNTPKNKQFISVNLQLLLNEFNISKHTAYVHRTSLKKKKWLTASSYLHPSLVQMRKAIEEGDLQLTIVFNEKEQ